MKKRVLITNDCLDIAKDILTKEYDVYQHHSGNLSQQQFIELASKCDGVITSLHDQVNADVIEACPSVKIFANCAVGYNNFDMAIMKKAGVYASNTPDVLSDTTAEAAWSLLMAVSRRIVEADRFVREKKWKDFSYRMLLGQDIYNKKLGIIGAGRIGHRFAEKARGYHMDIYYYNRQRNYDFEKSFDATYLSLEEMMRLVDVLSIHCPLTEETKGLIDKKAIDSMKPNAILINTARGEVMDYEALILALQEKRIFGAGLDVYPDEPNVDERLLELDNVVLSPHIGSASYDTRYKMAKMAAYNVISVLEGKQPVNPVD